jgi:hypothetical protein
MRLYVANTSKQNHDLLFRLPEDTRVHSERIPMGEQRRIYSDDLTREQVDAIISQHTRYGLADSRTLDQTRGFVGLCQDQNGSALNQRSHTIRHENAVSVFDELQKATHGKVRKLDLESTEDPKKASDTGLFEEHLFTEGEPAPRGRLRRLFSGE